MMFEFVRKHKSKIFITAMLLILIFSISTSFASGDGDNLQANNESVEMDSQIDESLEIDEEASQSQADDAGSGDHLLESSERLSAAEDSNLELSEGQGKFSDLATLVSKNRLLELDKDYVRNGYYSSSSTSSGRTTYYYQIPIEKAITIDGKGHFLDGEGNGPIFSIKTHEKVTFKNITFKNTPGFAITSVYLHDGVVEFENCTFLDTKGGFSLAGTYGSTGVLVKGSFKNIRFITTSNVNSNFFYSSIKYEGDFEDILIVNTCGSELLSGTTYATIRSTAYFKGNFNNVKIINCSGTEGGAMHFEGECHANFTNVDFINNAARYGGAIYTKVPIVGSFDNVRFINNSAQPNYGGAIYSTAGLNVDFKNVEFINNTANTGGGAIYASSLASSFDNVTFRGNKVFNINTNTFYGGAIYCSGFNSTFNNVNFTDNGIILTVSNSAYGGAIYATSVTGGSFKNVNFENNKVVSRSATNAFAGAVYMVGGAVSFENVNFTNNYAVTSGGALYYSSPAALSLVDVNFNSNRVNSTSDGKNYAGGAVFLTGSRTTSFAEFERTTFFNNSARYYGGALSSNSVNVKLSDCIFNENIAGKEGGAIHTRGTLNITRSNLTGNHAPVGSAIATSEYYMMIINIDECNFTKNNGSVVETYYTYPYGGDLNISNSNFDLNYGDAIISKYVTHITNCNITNNTGRAIYFNIYDGSSSYYWGTQVRTNYLDRVTCINNTAANGSAILNRDANLTISNSVFLHNKANSTALKINYDKFNHIIEVEYLVGNNYINAIDSNMDVNFTNVTYFDYNGIMNSDDAYPVRTYSPPHATIPTEVYESETDLIAKFNIISDDNGLIEYPYKTPIIHHIVVSHLDDDYYTDISSQYLYTWGDFDELQRLVLATPEGGVLNLTRNFTYIVGIDSITEGVFINKTITINGNGFTINALNQSRIFKLEADNIKLYDIKFANANGLEGSFIYGVDVNNTEIDKCVFDNFNVSSQNQVEYNGGAIYLTGNNSLISNSKFRNLMAMYGGAIYSNCTYMTIYNSDFDNCYAVNGGAVYVDGGALNNVIDHSTFINCNASYYGGAVCWIAEYGIIKDSTFKSNAIEKLIEIGFDTIDLNGGGAVLWYGAHGLISGSNFTDNRAIVKGSAIFKDALCGGAVLLFGLSTNVTECVFRENYAQSGGAVAIMNMSYNSVHPKYVKGEDLEKLYGFNSNIVKCTFIDNFAQYGGALLLKSYKNNVINSEFYNNTAYLGGAIILEGMNGVINNSLFENNVAHLGGAVVSGYNGTFNEKSSEEYWDDYWGEWRYRVVLIPYPRFSGDSNTIVNSQFLNNSADSAGAVLWMDKNGIIKDNTLFKYNKVADSYARYNQSFVRAYGEEVPKNAYESIQTNPNAGVMGLLTGLYAKDYAGALYWVGSNGLIDNVDFTENTAVNGGALFQEISSVLVNSSRFVKNHGEYGGAIWANNNSRISYSNFSENNATLGGAIYLYGSNSQIESSQLFDNKAQFGGAIYVVGEFNTLLKSELRFNKAGYGSAIYLDARGLTITSTTLLENQANSTSLFVKLNTTKTSLVADVVLVGGDNLMNAIYTLSSNYVLNDVTYWRIEGVVNSDDLAPRISDLESGQNITIELFTYNTIVPLSAFNLTDNDGYTRVSVQLNSGRYVVLVSHKEDNYYGEINDTSVVEFELLDPFTIVNVKDISYKENATVSVTCANGATGNVTLFVDGAEFDTKVLNGNAATFIIPNLKGGTHNVTAHYLGDRNYASAVIDKQFNVNPIASYINVNCTGGKYKDSILINVSAGPDEITGEVILTIENIYGESINITDIKSFTKTVSNLTAGKYEVTVYYKGDNNYLTAINNASFEIEPIDLPANAYANPDQIPSNRNATFSVEVPEDFNGKVRITVDGISRVYNVTGSTILIFDKLFLGQKTAKIDFFDDKDYNELSLNAPFEIIKPGVSASGFGTVNADNMTRGINSPYDYQAAFLDYEGNLLINIDVKFIVNGKEYTAVTNKDGIAQLVTSNLPVGKYDITSINLLTGEESTRQLNIFKRISENKDLTVDFASGKYFTVKVWGDDGKIAPEGEFVSMSIGKDHYVCRIDKNGVARLKITFNPNTYTIVTEYKGYKVTNKIVVKQTLKLVKKTVKVKKGKKLVLKAKLVWSNGKGISGKVIQFKFNGKTYKGKTNSKGIAKVTVKKKATKNLKKGKKYSVAVTYAIKDKYGNDYMTVSEAIKMFVKVK